MRIFSKNKYQRALIIACELLNGDTLYGVEANEFKDTIFEKVMEEQGSFFSSDYERYILDNIDYLTYGASGKPKSIFWRLRYKLVIAMHFWKLFD